jgi:predicted dithiol-disulfide oxidoreductase (DUF899 family)
VVSREGRAFGRSGNKQALNRACQYLDLVPKGRDERALNSRWSGYAGTSNTEAPRKRSTSAWAGASPGVSSYHNDFNYDFGVSFRPEEVASGRVPYNFQPAHEWVAGVEDPSDHSIFYRDADGRIFHTYSTYGRCPY